MASADDYFKKVGSPGNATTLAAPGHTIGGTSFTVDATSLWPTDTGVTFAIDTVTVAGGETRVPGTYTVWDGVVSSGTTITGAVLRYGTDQNYSAGSTTRVYILPTSTRENKLVDGLLIAHEQTGIHKSGASYPAPVFSGTATGTYTLGGTPTISSPILSGTTSGTYTMGGTVSYSGTHSAWISGVTVPNTVTCNGNRSYDLVINSTDLTGYLSAGMRLRTTRTSAAPTQCADLESGSSHYFSKTSPTGLSFTTTFTCSAWVKLESYTTGGIIARRNASTEGWSFGVNSSGQLEMAALRIAGNFRTGTTYQSLPLNKWVHVAASMDVSVAGDAAHNMYIDGVLVPSVNATTGTCTALVQGTTALVVGSQQSAGTNYFDGKIAQAAVFSSVLSAATIRSYMSQGLSGSESTNVSAFSLNGVLTDLNANANTLTAQNSATATNADSPFGGQADGTISSTLDYAIIDNIAFSTNTTITVRTSEVNTIPTTGGVSAMSYSTQASPYGCPPISNVIGQSLIMANTSIATSVLTDANGYTTTVYIPFGRKVKVSYLGQWQNLSAAASFGYIAILDGSTAVQMALSTNGGAGSNFSIAPYVILNPTAGSHTYKIQAAVSSGTIVLEGGPTPTAAPAPGPSGIQVELI